MFITDDDAGVDTIRDRRAIRSLRLLRATNRSNNLTLSFDAVVKKHVTQK